MQGFRMQEGTEVEIKLEVKGETGTLVETVRGSRVGSKDESLRERSKGEGVTTGRQPTISRLLACSLIQSVITQSAID